MSKFWVGARRERVNSVCGSNGVALMTERLEISRRIGMRPMGLMKGIDVERARENTYLGDFRESQNESRQLEFEL